jgi:Protein of unknown function (DUF3800)
MDTAKKRQKIYAYVDESGQDDDSKVFIVVSVVTVNNQDQLREQLLKVEEDANTHALKWNQSRHDRRMKYLSLVLQRKIGAGFVFMGRFKKPVPYFHPIASVIEKAVKQAMGGEKYLAIVRVDGINKKIAVALTNALRANGVSLKQVKGKRDEGEVLIRFADMWAGCVRGALLNEKDDDVLFLFREALRTGYLKEVTN